MIEGPQLIRVDIGFLGWRRGLELRSIGPFDCAKAGFQLRSLHVSRGDRVRSGSQLRHADRHGDEVRDVAHEEGVQITFKYENTTHPGNADRQRPRWCHPVHHANTTSLKASVGEVMKIKVENSTYLHVDDRYLSRTDA